MPNFKMTYPYDMAFHTLGVIAVGQVISADENPNPNVFEATSDPVSAPNKGAQSEDQVAQEVAQPAAPEPAPAAPAPTQEA